MKIKNLSKKISAVLLSLAILTSTLMLQTFSAFAENVGGSAVVPPSTVWNGTIASSFAGGDGTETNPYQIATGEQLALLGKYVQDANASYNSRYYILNNSILLNNSSADNWYEGSALNKWSYGAGTATFNGSLNGNGYVIRGIYIKTNLKYVGLFPRLNYHTTVKNLGIESSYIETTNTGGAAGGLVGGITNYADGDHIIENCYVSDTVTVKSAGIAGGLIGNDEVSVEGRTVRISNCYSAAVVEGTRKASLIGFWYNAKGLSVTSSYATQSDLKMLNPGTDTADKHSRLLNNTYFTNCYTLGVNSIYVNSDNPNYAFSGITQLTSDKITGNEATVNMAGFKFPRLWYARANEYPVPSVFMHLPPDTTKPTLTGAVSSKTFAIDSAAVVWPLASDDISTPDDMVYNLYVSEMQINDLGGIKPYGSYVGLDDAIVDGLEAGKKYYFAVVAVDNAGNESDKITGEYTHTKWESINVWDGTVADELILGTGTISNPYKITSAKELAYLVNLSNSENAKETKNKNYILTVDIDLTGKEWAVGTSDDISENAFFGTFDGNGHIIKGLYIDKNAKKYNGLFAGLNENATVKNLGVDNVNIKAVDEGYAGAFAGGRSSKSKNDGVIIQYSYIGGEGVIEGAYSGGFIGTAEAKTTFISCYSKAEPNGKNAAGTFVGNHAVDKVEIIVNGSYSTSKLPLVAKTGKKAIVTYENSYTTGKDAKGLASITLENMNGDKAKSYMSTFDFANVWHTREDDTPTLSLFVPANIWDGSVASSFSGGDGSENNPYLIADASQLALLGTYVQNNNAAYNTTSKYYKLTNDIILNDVSTSEWYTKQGLNEWIYGASNSTTFNSNLNGNGHIIKGIYIKTDKKYAGLFPRLGYHTTIKNLGIELSYIESSLNNSSAGSFAGSTSNWADGDHVIDSCYSADTVIIKSSFAGGIFGANEMSTQNFKVKIKNCYSSSKLNGIKKNGSFIGNCWRIDHLNIQTSYATQSGIDLTNNHKDGGNYNDNFKNCYTTGTNTRGYANIKVVKESEITGNNAKDTLKGFSFANKNNPTNTWYTRYGKTPHLTIFNTSVMDFESPEFKDGKIEALEKTGISITITWPEAIDNYTPSAFMEYSIYYSDSEITSANIKNAKKLGNSGSEREITLTGLQLGDKVYFAVCAVDQAGNAVYLYADKAIKTERTKLSKVWSGNVARSFDFGDGSAENPYIITNAEQLAYLMENLGDNTKNKYYAIENNIILNDVTAENWTKGEPNEWIYGTDEYDYSPFYGTLDGRGHIISGLYINLVAKQAGLFVEVGGSATIQNLGIIDSYISINNDKTNCYAGAFSGGRNSKADGDGEVKLIRCFVAQSVTVYAQTENNKCSALAAGFIGKLQQGQGEASKAKTLLQDCYSGVEVYGTKDSCLFLGDCYAKDGAVNLERCFSILLNTRWVYDWYDKNKDMDTVVYHDCYSPDISEEGLQKTDIVKMLGKDAKIYMSALDFENIWTTATEAPRLKVFGNHPEYALKRTPVTISFDTDGAGEIEPIIGLVGNTLELPTVKRSGYIFKGWNIYPNFPYPIDTFPAYDITLKADWQDLSVLRVNFESYPYKNAGEDGLGYDYELYRPGIAGYNTKYVHAGGYSMHRIGTLDTEQSFQLFDVNSAPLEVGKNYQLTMWVYADDITSGSIQLESSDRIKISKKSTVITTVTDVKSLKKGEWQEVTVNFTVENKYLLIRTSGSNSLYFDDIAIYSDSSVGNGKSPRTGESNAIVVCLSIFAVSAVLMIIVIVIKKKKISEVCNL